MTAVLFLSPDNGDETGSSSPCSEVCVIGSIDLFSSLLVGGATILCVPNNGKGSPSSPTTGIIVPGASTAVAWLNTDRDGAGAIGRSLQE